MQKCQGVSSSNTENISSDHNILVIGGYGQGTVWDIENESGYSFDIDKLPGVCEYFLGFAVAKDSTIFATTSAYRVIKRKQVGAGISKTVKEVYWSFF